MLIAERSGIVMAIDVDVTYLTGLSHPCAPVMTVFFRRCSAASIDPPTPRLYSDTASIRMRAAAPKLSVMHLVPGLVIYCKPQAVWF